MGDYDEMLFDTRKTSRRKRKLGKGKQSSVLDDSPFRAATEPQLKRSTKAKDGPDEDCRPVGTMAILPGIEKCFVGAKKGARGLQKALKKSRGRVSIYPTAFEVSNFEKLKSNHDPSAKDIQDLSQRYLDMNGLGWLWQMQQDFNILLFGVGCKYELLRKFCDEYLYGHQVLMIDGNSDHSAATNRVISALLDKISSSILNIDDSSHTYLNLESYVRKLCDSLDDHYSREMIEYDGGILCSDVDSISGDQDDEDSLNDLQQSNSITSTKVILEDSVVILREVTSSSTFSSSTSLKSHKDISQKSRERSSHKRSKLYILVNSIEGESLRSDESQSCLSLLAACSSISIIATADNLNASALWSPLMLSNFRWINSHVPTYKNYASDAKESIHSNGGRSEILGGTKALEYIYKSLTKRHEELITLLANDAINQHENGLKKSSISSRLTNTGNESNILAHYYGITFEELLIETSKKVIARSSAELNVLLKELTDHKLVSKEADSSRRFRVMILLPINELRKQVNRRKG